MLREIINAFRRKDVVHDLSGKLMEMLEAGRWMFERASQALLGKVDWQPMADELYGRDQQINRLEQQIRERIVTHLSVGNSADLAACLALMNVVKDAERIGDYCKNIFEVGRFYRDEYEHPEYREPLNDIQHRVLDLFDKTAEAFRDAQTDQAREVMTLVDGLGQRCDQLIQQLLRLQDTFPADEAVAYVLLARHYKRVAAHLANIATSVVSPVPKLDFR